MSRGNIDDPMLEAYVYETSQIIEELEQLMISSERDESFDVEAINEIFRYMHTIKGSSAMMMFNEISTLAHKIEDIFFIIREDNTTEYDFSRLVDIILESIDFFKIELMKIVEGEEPDGDSAILLETIKRYSDEMKGESSTSDSRIETPKKEVSQEKQKYYISPKAKPGSGPVNHFHAVIHFHDDAEMENIRAYTLINNLLEVVDDMTYKPKDIIENDTTAAYIKENGFELLLKSKLTDDEMKKKLDETIFLKELEYETISSEEFEKSYKFINGEVEDDEVKIPEISEKFKKQEEKKARKERGSSSGQTKQTMISVHVDKLDNLMDMVGELVIAEAMVTHNPEVNQLEIESFEKASRQLHKITGELQDMVMAIRMVPLSTTFMKMHRIVRDMTKKLEKNVDLVVFGEETEVDKNIIEKISDPLMHIIRNSIDHGIESKEDRRACGKEEKGTVILEAKNSGSDVMIVIKDDGKGLDKQKIYEKAYENGLIDQPIEELSDRDVFNMILQPGFSTKEQVTEFSGRGVGMDVVTQNLQSVGGSVVVDSIFGQGTTITLKIPLTLAIIEGMNIKVGDLCFTLPIMAIKESFRPHINEVFKDTNNQEMIMVRGLCYPVFRLHDFYRVPTDITDFSEGILIMVEEDGKSTCIFADELIGQQQVVVKSLPNYIKKNRQIRGLSGCTLLGDGSISLILDVGQLDLVDVNQLVNLDKKVI